MTEETKKLFDAPWFPFSRACDFHGLKRSNGSEIFSDASLRSEVNRLARLPELYDALVVLAYDHCYGCMVRATRREPPPLETFIEHGCQCKAKQCEYNCWGLLKKVRDGK